MRGSVPDPRCPLPGCRFCPRCDQSRQDCARQVPDLRALAAGHWVRCCHIS
ncbi:MAG: oligopeptide/dipeptide ABC transporter ATP-binding protein [Evtepia gabavorous]